eukprot:TRINITY_DN7698_c0_g1_i1.p1 TRINITY_DN7698_c0_g1~~TRINITY_DN7698_c0_g1_i1.p1  ORF type:complete len:352 (-),score=43.71 TRINITY_DN7698_c0_g1_i1:37-984(-)
MFQMMHVVFAVLLFILVTPPTLQCLYYRVPDWRSIQLPVLQFFLLQAAVVMFVIRCVDPLGYRGTNPLILDRFLLNMCNAVLFIQALTITAASVNAATDNEYETSLQRLTRCSILIAVLLYFLFSVLEESVSYVVINTLSNTLTFLLVLVVGCLLTYFSAIVYLKVKKLQVATNQTGLEVGPAQRRQAARLKRFLAWVISLDILICLPVLVVTFVYVAIGLNSDAPQRPIHTQGKSLWGLAPISLAQFVGSLLVWAFFIRPLRALMTNKRALSHPTGTKSPATGTHQRSATSPQHTISGTGSVELTSDVHPHPEP